MQTSSSEYSLKSKWNQLVNKRTDSSYTCKDHRRPSHCSDQSVCSSTSTSTLDKLLLGIPGLFRRRCSNASSSDHLDEEKESEKLDELYQSALDEISYAEDSQGSRYYPGDVASAKEAMDICTNAFIELLQQAPDRQTHDHLYAAIAPRLWSLRSRFDALPTIIID
ncbi:uncharacterized protein BX664DRAFT_322276 [Halteromyces radiatus]|uniref:uncharacterized protein n=1 Tax=Halteromyces radiatus TaxID=101107 RepID=UPI002220AF4E|nr:uncharacterized protein BX664DRAFT_322276 [Halteromyces radiatus]KAI8099863.1 hypothetical protein BX664DRAFT_322276 [Halteromyces radiatus]